MNLDAIKEVTLDLLYLDPEQDERFPFIVHHPFFSNSMCFDGEMFDLFDDVDRAREPYRKMISEADDVHQLLILVGDPYKMLWFKLCAPYIDGPDYSELLKACWTMEEFSSRDVNVSLDEMAELFERADLVPDWFPETVRVYRGVCLDGSPYGMSWSLVFLVAKRFATRFGEGKVYALDVPREHVLAYIEDRGENEVVLDARKLKDKVELEMDCAELPMSGVS